MDENDLIKSGIVKIGKPSGGTIDSPKKVGNAIADLVKISACALGIIILILAVMALWIGAHWH